MSAKIDLLPVSYTHLEEYYEIDGYERYYTNIDFSRPSFKNPSTFYYTRAKYDLTLINGTIETTKKDIPYKSDISKYLGAPTVKPTLSLIHILSTNFGNKTRHY